MSEVLQRRKVKVEGPPETKRSRGGGDVVGDQRQPDGGRVAASVEEQQEADPDLDVGRDDDPEHDRRQYRQACQSLAELMAEMQELRSSGSEEEALERKRMQGCVRFVTLKRLNRRAHTRLKRGRDRTHDAKQRVDALHLQLQNLLYRVVHQQREIARCLEVRSEHDHVELASEEDFYREAPPAVARADATRGDAHQRTLARLHWELEHRKRLAEQYAQGQATRERRRRSIQEKRELLGSLQPGLGAITRASVPLQEFLSAPSSSSSAGPSPQRQAEAARHLPAPLYVLFVQASAYGRACDRELCVSIGGDAEEAKSALSSPKQRPDDDVSRAADEPGRSDNAEDEGEVERRRHATDGGQLDGKRREMLQRHPLSVCLDVRCEGGSVLHVYFYHLTNLDILTVQTKVTLTPASDDLAVASAAKLLNPATLLHCLRGDGDDRGQESPNPANRYQLDRVGIASFADHAEELGRPYLWAQSLGGLRFLDGDAPPEEGVGAGGGSSLSASHMERTVKLLRARLESRLALRQQFASLETSVVPAECQRLPTTLPGDKMITSRLVSWTAVSYREYRDLAFAASENAGGLVKEEEEETDAMMYFVGVVERGGARLRAAVALSPRYPAVAPLFSLSLGQKGEELNGSADDDDGLRAAESRVNQQQQEAAATRPPGPRLLSDQLARLCVCLDAYLEPAEGSQGGAGRCTSADPDISPVDGGHGL